MFVVGLSKEMLEESFYDFLDSLHHSYQHMYIHIILKRGGIYFSIKGDSGKPGTKYSYNDRALPNANYYFVGWFVDYLFNKYGKDVIKIVSCGKILNNIDYWKEFRNKTIASLPGFKKDISILYKD